jgi:hypothetical protein
MIKIEASMACKPEQWMYAGKFEDMFVSVKIQEPDKIIFEYEPSDPDYDSCFIIYEIEDHFDELGVDYMDIETV